ncbi:Alpha-(1 3)-fucosyltransferase 7 [Mactra antiquata]
MHLPNSVDFRKTYLVLWHKIPAYLGRKSEAVSANFSVCEYHNCVLTTNSTLANISDAILWHRTQNGAITFKRPVGQIWVYVDHESPALLDLDLFKAWKPNLQYWMGKFNWTMTYNKAVADIHMPYGELRKHKTYIDKDYDRIAASKTRGALIISSHCSTNSKRQEYVNQLKKYVDVEVLGTCGKRWSCGKRLVHDNCFDILNTSYSFYLAFENALCEQYHTEKLFENFKYDILFVSRGGLPRELNTFLPEGSVIDSRAFKSERELGTYLKHLQRNKHEYAKLLSAKSQFYSIDYRHSYQRALCDLCHRLNHQETYRKTISNLRDVFSHKKSCKAG